MRFPRWGAIVVVLGLGFARSADADDDTSLDQARRDVESSDYLGARSALVAALDAGNASPTDLAEIYKLSGIVEGALGNEAAATTAFTHWVALDAKAAMPVGTSPKIMRPFEVAVAKVKQLAPLKVKTETSAAPPRVTVVVVSDPLALISRARVEFSADGQPEQMREGAGKHRIAIELPHGKRLDLRVQALDVHGNRVVELGSSDVPIVITGAEPQIAPKPTPTPTERVATTPAHPAPPPNERPLYLQWWAWTGAALAFGAGATAFGVLARHEANEVDQLNATSSQHNFDEALAAQSRAQRDALLFNVGVGVAGAFALGAAILYVTAPRAAAETRMTVVPARGGGAAVIGGRF